MASGIITIASLVPIGLVLRNLIIREGQIRKIKEKSDQIVGMICGTGFIQVSEMSLD